MYNSLKQSKVTFVVSEKDPQTCSLQILKLSLKFDFQQKELEFKSKVFYNQTPTFQINSENQSQIQNFLG